MPVIMIVITGAAANLRRLSIDQRHDGMIGDATALDAMVVDDVTQSLFSHANSRQMEYIKVATGAQQAA